KSQAIGDRVPIILVIEVENLFSRSVDEANAFAAVVQCASELSSDRQPAAVALREGRGILDDEHARSRRKTGDRAPGEIEGDAVGKAHAIEVERGGGGNVLQLDIFVLVLRIGITK